MSASRRRSAGVERLPRKGPAAGQLVVDGRPVPFFEGETIAIAILAEATAIGEGPERRRAIYCGIGACFECAVRVDGQLVRACMTPAEPGANVSTARPLGGHRGC